MLYNILVHDIGLVLLYFRTMKITLRRDYIILLRCDNGMSLYTVTDNAMCLTERC